MWHILQSQRGYRDWFSRRISKSIYNGNRRVNFEIGCSRLAMLKCLWCRGDYRVGEFL